MQPVADLQYGHWPGRTSRWVALGLLTLVFGGITVAAWVAVFQGHPEALILGTSVPAIAFVMARWFPVSAARLRDGVLTMPSLLRGEVHLDLARVTSVRVGPLRSPMVVLEAPGRRAVRWWVSAEGESILTVMRPSVPFSADQLPDGVEWLRPRRRLWWVVALVVEVTDKA